MKKFVNEFWTFAMKGNVLDLAVGVVLGSAFNAIISSLVKDIIMPLLSIVLGHVNVSDLHRTIPGLFGSADIVLTYGAFLQAGINFLVIALTLFLCIKLIARMKSRRRSEEKIPETEEPGLSRSEQLLTEIRDLLDKQNQSAG